MEFPVRDKVLYLKSVPTDGKADWLDLFRNGSVDEVFVDVSGKTLEQISRDVIHLRTLLKDIPNLFEPIVMGPFLNGPDSATCRVLAARIIRATPLGFDDYCDSLADGHTADQPSQGSGLGR